MIRLKTAFSGLFCALLALSAVHAISIGQVDDFQDGTAMNWIHGSPGSPTPPVNVPDIGPGGMGDNALWNQSRGGGGPGSRMAMLNRTQWTGDYTSAGVTSISMMLRSDPAASPVNIRLGFEAELGERAVSDAFSVPNDGNWYNFTYDIDPSSLFQVGSAAPADVLLGVQEFRILSSDIPEWQGAAIPANLFVDNITAIPEPAVSLSLIGMMLLALRRKIG